MLWELVTAALAGTRRPFLHCASRGWPCPWTSPAWLWPAEVDARRPFVTATTTSALCTGRAVPLTRCGTCAPTTDPARPWRSFDLVKRAGVIRVGLGGLCGGWR